MPLEPRVDNRKDFLPRRGCVICRTPNRHNPVGVGDDFDSCSQRSSFLATAGLNYIAPLGQTNWSEQRRIVAKLDALQAEVDALKRLQAESRQGLHPPLDAFPPSPSLRWTGLPAILDRAFKGEL
jgi:hypothetical protein